MPREMARAKGLGGMLFLISDFLIAFRVAETWTVPGPPIWVMLTYAAAQFLIATGWIFFRRSRAFGREPRE